MTVVHSTVADRAILRANPQLADASWAAVDRFGRTAACLGVVAIALALCAGRVGTDLYEGVVAGALLCSTLLAHAIGRLMHLVPRLQAGWVIVARQCVPPEVLLDAGALRRDLRVRLDLDVSPRPDPWHWLVAALAGGGLAAVFVGPVVLLSGGPPPGPVLPAGAMLAFVFGFYLAALRLTLGIRISRSSSGRDDDDEQVARGAAIAWLQARMHRLRKRTRARRQPPAAAPRPAPVAAASPAARAS